MKILDYYVTKQADDSWYKEFQSISDKCSGKLYDFIDTNFRKLSSFFSQLDAFRTKDGLKRSQWSTMDCGQEEDKHRVVNLKNAGLITFDGERYHITAKGNEVLRLNDIDGLTDREKWVLLLMLLVDYKTDKSKMVIIKTAINLAEVLSKFGIDRTTLMGMLRKASGITKKDILFQNDIFWLLTFYKDDKFISLYISSTESEKKELYDYVNNCSKNKKSKDCIAHKFVNSGAYSATTFNDDINITLCILVLAAIKDKNWDGFINLICKYYSIREDKIKGFMAPQLDLYNDIYDHTFGLLNR